jgi:hypothetical protein
MVEIYPVQVVAVRPQLEGQFLGIQEHFSPIQEMPGTDGAIVIGQYPGLGAVKLYIGIKGAPFITKGKIVASYPPPV